MKRLTLLLITLIGVMFSSCEDNLGYPEKVEFTNEGGTIILTSDKGFCMSGIRNGNNTDFLKQEYFEFEPDSFAYVTEWLTAKGKLNDKTLLLEAKPNDTGIDRRASIVFVYFYDSAIVYIIQKK
jgi:hypothetical protein